MRQQTVRAWSAVHSWTSLLCTVFLLMLCVTGLPLIFHDEIGKALSRDSWQPANPGGRLLGYDQVLAIALKARPGEAPLYMSFDEDRPVVNVTTAGLVDGASGPMHFASYDLTNGKAAPQVSNSGMMNFLVQLHTDLFLGLPGRLFLGAMGLLFASAIISGVVIYAPFMRKLPFGAVRASRSSRAKWLDLHNLVGVVTVAWALTVGLTGVVNTLATPIVNYWKEAELSGFVTAESGDDVAAPIASLEQAIRTAKRALPGMSLQFVAFPGSAYSTRRHYAVFFHGDKPLTKQLITPALIDAQTGKLVAVRPMPWYANALSLSQPMHFGDYGGLSLKIVWALLDAVTITVMGSGVYLWAARRSARRAIPSPAE